MDIQDYEHLVAKLNKSFDLIKKSLLAVQMADNSQDRNLALGLIRDTCDMAQLNIEDANDTPIAAPSRCTEATDYKNSLLSSVNNAA